jgi:hypothetical protein
LGIPARLLSGSDAHLGFSLTATEPNRFVAGLHDMTAVREAIEQCGRHLGVAENAGPFTAVQIGRDHHAGVLVELAEQVKQQRDSCLAERL